MGVSVSLGSTPQPPLASSPHGDRSEVPHSSAPPDEGADSLGASGGLQSLASGTVLQDICRVLWTLQTRSVGLAQGCRLREAIEDTVPPSAAITWWMYPLTHSGALAAQTLYLCPPVPVHKELSQGTLHWPFTPVAKPSDPSQWTALGSRFLKAGVEETWRDETL